MFNVLTVSWASVTVVLVGLLIYRALIGMREEDQLFLASGEEHLARDQQILQARITSVNKYAVWVGALSAQGTAAGSPRNRWTRSAKN